MILGGWAWRGPGREGWLAASLAFVHQVLVTHPPTGRTTEKGFQPLPNIPWGQSGPRLHFIGNPYSSVTSCPNPLLTSPRYASLLPFPSPLSKPHLGALSPVHPAQLPFYTTEQPPPCPSASPGTAVLLSPSIPLTLVSAADATPRSRQQSRHRSTGLCHTEELLHCQATG